MSDEMLAELLQAIDAWDRAMIANDADAIGAFMADDWTIVGPDGSLNVKPSFLELIRSGMLTHDVMETAEIDARLYGDTAVVVARGVSGGAYAGERFLLTERVSCTYVRRHGHWRCVLTHLSRLDDAD